jgi:hypothetical protein
MPNAPKPQLIDNQLRVCFKDLPTLIGKVHNEVLITDIAVAQWTNFIKRGLKSGSVAYGEHLIAPFYTLKAEVWGVRSFEVCHQAVNNGGPNSNGIIDVTRTFRYQTDEQWEMQKWLFSVKRDNPWAFAVKDLLLVVSDENPDRILASVRLNHTALQDATLYCNFLIAHRALTEHGDLTTEYVKRGYPPKLAYLLGMRDHRPHTPLTPMWHKPFPHWNLCQKYFAPAFSRPQHNELTRFCNDKMWGTKNAKYDINYDDLIEVWKQKFGPVPNLHQHAEVVAMHKEIENHA